MTDPQHPRYRSLLIREKLTRGLRQGLASQTGLIAHGRGEAFDYLLGEKTHAFAAAAIRAAAALLLLCEKPVLSVNGNTASLVAEEIISLAKELDCKIEVNLYHHSKKRVKAIEKVFSKRAKTLLLRSDRFEKITIPEVASKRKITLREGIGSADCILVPLEDGDRCAALKKMGKKVITIDLNPLSRTAQTGDITIVDNIVRCLPLITQEIKGLKGKKRVKLSKIVKNFNNRKNLKLALRAMCYHTFDG